MKFHLWFHQGYINFLLRSLVVCYCHFLLLAAHPRGGCASSIGKGKDSGKQVDIAFTVSVESIQRLLWKRRKYLSRLPFCYYYGTIWRCFTLVIVTLQLQCDCVPLINWEQSLLQKAAELHGSKRKDWRVCPCQSLYNHCTCLYSSDWYMLLIVHAEILFHCISCSQNSSYIVLYRVVTLD